MRLLLLDGYNLLYRAFTSLPPAITGTDGRPIHAVYGLASTVLRLWRETGADRVIAAFDEPDTPTFRHGLYAPYQGQRGPLGGEEAPDFRRQSEIARRVLLAADIPVVSRAGYEADDIMGTLAVAAAATGDEAIIVSTDRDLLQLVRPGIGVVAPGKTRMPVADAEGVRARMGVAPEGITTLKALAGDASDNVPGVVGVGMKTAAALVNQYGTLEEIYARLGELSPRVGRLLAAQREQAFLFRTVVSIVTDLELPLSIDKVSPPRLDAETRVRTLIDSVDAGMKSRSPEPA